MELQLSATNAASVPFIVVLTQVTHVRRCAFIYHLFVLLTARGQITVVLLCRRVDGTYFTCDVACNLSDLGSLVSAHVFSIVRVLLGATTGNSAISGYWPFLQPMNFKPQQQPSLSFSSYTVSETCTVHFNSVAHD